MTQDDIIQLAREAGLHLYVNDMTAEPYANIVERFAALVAAAEREKVARWMLERGYATGHGDTIEDLLQELDWQIAENWNRALINGITTEREACAQVCEELHQPYAAGESWEDGTYDCAAAIRARGKTK